MGLIHKQAGLNHDREMRAKIESFLKDRIAPVRYTINDDWTIDVEGDVHFDFFEEEQLPDYIQFGIVRGTFTIQYCENLKTLRGCPVECTAFNCRNCQSLETLEGGPKIICNHELYSYPGYDCSDCPELKSFKGAPQEFSGRDVKFNANGCSLVESLEGLGKGVREVSVNGTKIKSLEFLPEETKTLHACRCWDLESLVTRNTKLTKATFDFKLVEEEMINDFVSRMLSYNSCVDFWFNDTHIKKSLWG